MPASLQSRDADEPIKVGFLYNHDGLHQIAHTGPIISSLQRIAPELRVEVLISSESQARAVRRHLDPSLEQPPFHQLEVGKAIKRIEKLTGGIVPLGRIGSLAANKRLLGSYDALVVPETTTTLLKTRHKLHGPRLIHYPHGAGDRSISVSPAIKHFDFVLLPGKKTQERMLAEGVIRAQDNAIIGYPKFDARHLAKQTKFFPNDRPVVLYNPHFDPKLSSWHDFGIELLDYFAGQDRYNLIFAPHVMLFKRKVLASVEHQKIKVRQSIPSRFHNLDHIRIDTGSEFSVDMSYTRNADFYIGDVSSQIYEFIERPRPAIFLNSHNADWQNDSSYVFWHFGEVIDQMKELPAAMERAFPMDEKFRRRQSETFKEAIDIDPDHSSASRGAAAIYKYLHREFPERFQNG